METLEPSERPARGDEISLAAAGATLLRGRRTLLAALALGGLAGVLLARISPPAFRSSSTFMTQGSTSQGQVLAGLAGQLGFSIPRTENAESPEFYQALLTSREILETVVRRSYSVQSDDGIWVQQTLLEIIEAEGTNDAEKLANGIEWLKGAMTSSVNRHTTIVSLSVKTHQPRLSQELTAALLEAVEIFNLQTRLTQAHAEREFLEERVAAAEEQLKGAEAVLQRFLQENRQFSNSPELTFQFDRLQREVAMRQQIYTALMDAFEQARIREIHDIPLLTVLEHPIEPPFRAARGTVLKGELGMVFGVVAGLLLIFLRAQKGQQDPDVESLRREWKEVKSDLRRLLPHRRGA